MANIKASPRGHLTKKQLVEQLDAADRSLLQFSSALLRYDWFLFKAAEQTNFGTDLSDKLKRELDELLDGTNKLREFLATIGLHDKDGYLEPIGSSDSDSLPFELKKSE